MGLDWIPYAFGLAKLDLGEIRWPSKLSEVREKFNGMNEDDKLDYAIEYSETLFNREENRRETIETKASTLLGVTGLATTFVTGVVGIYPDKIFTMPTGILFAITFLYILIVFSLIMTILLAYHTIIVGRYLFTYPSIDDLLKLPAATLVEVKRERLSSIYYSYEKNTENINLKASYVIGSQLWFRNSMVLLLLLALVLAIVIPAVGKSQQDLLPLQTPSLTTNVPTENIISTVTTTPMEKLLLTSTPKPIPPTPPTQLPNIQPLPISTPTP